MKVIKWINFFYEMKLKGKRVYTLAEIANIDNTTIKSAKTILQRLKKNNILINICKNVWAVPDTEIFSIAALFDKDSYCSMETALFRYNLIKQAPQTFHFVSKYLSKKRNTQLGVIYFHKIKKSLFFGFQNGIAEPEKALLDYIYFCFKDGRHPFRDYDLTSFESINIKKLKKYSDPFPKSVKKYLSLNFTHIYP